MFIEELFYKERDDLNVKWDLSLEEVTSFIKNHVSEYHQVKNTIIFKTKDINFNHYCKINFNNSGTSIKNIHYQMHSTRTDYERIFKDVYNRVIKLMGFPIIKENLDNMDLKNDYLEFYPKVAWQNKYINMELFLVDVYGLYWILDIKSTSL